MVKTFHNYLNTVSTSIKFTKEPEKSGQLSCLNLNVQQLKDRSLAATVYGKPTHTDRYLQYSSHHLVNEKVSVARTLFSRANKITSNNKKILKNSVTKQKL